MIELIIKLYCISVAFVAGIVFVEELQFSKTRYSDMIIIPLLWPVFAMLAIVTHLDKKMP